jgi:hypothetical protein
VQRVYVPISIRFDTNSPRVFYEALATRLGAILGKPPKAPPVDPVTFFKERVREYLREFSNPAKPCLIVIDGLDEAAGWTLDRSFLPAKPPPGLKILVSARQMAGHRGGHEWLRLLGWQDRYAGAISREVEPLTREGVIDVLHRMGDPLSHLSADVPIVDELYRLTNHGDPLLLSFYVETLADPDSDASRLRPENLRNLKPGFADFFQNWYDDQREAWEKSDSDVDEVLIEHILAILASAMGPLLPSDIEAVLARMRPGSTTPVTLTTLRPLARFLIGNTDEALEEPSAAQRDATGFVLSHPRLGEFFRTEFLAFRNSTMMQRADAAFIDWGREVAVGGGAKPEPAVPRYVLAYYLQHLERHPKSDPMRYRELAEDRWRQAWFKEEGGYRSFSEQMDVCWRRLIEEHRAHPTRMRDAGTGLGGLIHIGLCMSSVRSIGESIPPNFLAEMVRERLLTSRQAVLMARYRSSGSERAATLQALARVVDPADPAHFDIVDIGRAQPTLDLRAMVLLAAAEPASSLPLVEEVVRDAARAEEPEASHWVREAIEVAARIDSVAAKDLQLVAQRLLPKATLAVAPPDPTRETPAESPKRQIERQEPDPAFSPATFIRSVARFNDDGAKVDPPHDAPDPSRLDCLDAILEAYIWKRRDALARLAPNLTEIEMSAVLERITGREAWEIMEMIEEVLPYLNQAQRRRLIDWCLDPALEKLDAMTRSMVADRILPALPLEDIDYVVNKIESVSDDFIRLKVVESVADKVDEAAVEKIIDYVLSTAREHVAYTSTRMVGALGHRLTLQQIARVVAAAGELDSPMIALVGPIASMLHGELLDDALLAAISQRNSYYRREALGFLLPRLSPEQLERVIEAAGKAGDRADRLNLLDLALPYLAEARKREVMAGAHGFALEIGDGPWAALALAALGEQPELKSAPASSPWASYNREGRDDEQSALALCMTAVLPHVPAEVAETAFAQAEEIAESAAEGDEMVSFFSVFCPSLALERRKAAAAALGAKRDASPDEIVHLLLLVPSVLDEELARQIEKDAAAVFRDEKSSDDERASVAGILALAPQTAEPLAAEAISWIRRKIDEPECDAVMRACLIVALSLSPRLTASDIRSLPRMPAWNDLGEDGEDTSFGFRELIQFGLVRFLKGPDLDAATSQFLARLTELNRAGALGLLALVEGEWEDTLSLRPAISEGRPGASLLARLGGPAARAEVAAAVKATVEWWP